MAEKQYKNYDERFLKEESSGSKPVISYTTEELEECSVEQGSNMMILKLKKSNGEFVLNKDELRSMFLSGFFVDLSNTERSTIYSPMYFILNPSSSGESITLYQDSSGSAVFATDALSFEQIKQSQS